MPHVIINPGSGPVDSTTEDNATANMAVFCQDLNASGIEATGFSRAPEADYGDGRYAYDITFAAGHAVQVQMPGLPVDRVRYLGTESQNIWDYPRLYVDDNSWVWSFALTVCEPDEDDE